MLKRELLKLIENIEEEGSIDEVLTQSDFAKSLTSLDSFKKLVSENSDFKSYLDSEKDKHYSKALETWKTNNLGKLVEAELLKHNPKLSPEQLKIQELEKKFADMEKAKARAEMNAKFKDVLGEKKIPSKMIEFLLADDEDVTNANITLFEESMKSYIDEGVKVRLGESNYTPPQGGQPTGVTKEQFSKMGYKERVELKTNDPETYHNLINE